jgi:hypothetical protein
MLRRMIDSTSPDSLLALCRSAVVATDIALLLLLAPAITAMRRRPRQRRWLRLLPR